MQTLLLIFDIMGTLSFAVSGAFVAIRRHMDIFGVSVLAIATATGGGILRDLIIGRVPPQAFMDPRYVAIAAAAGLICFLVMYLHPRLPQKVTTAYDMVMFWFDTLGVAAFTVDGVAVAEGNGHSDNLFLVVFLGVITGVGGGLIRDVLASRVPEVFQKHVYALASILGALVAGLLSRWGVGDQISVISGFLVIVLLRILAAHFRWNLPRVGRVTSAPRLDGREQSDPDQPDHDGE